MAQYKYSYQAEENMAKAVGRDLSISTKHSIEICRHIRGMPLEKAMIVLEDTIDKKKAIPFKTFNWNLGHKTKIGPGRYPVKASKEILSVLENAENNAQFKGLVPARLKIIHCSAQKAFNPGKRGRSSGSDTKRTHIEVVVKEERVEKKATKKATKKPKKMEQKND